MVHSFSFNKQQFNRLFPFYILINKDLQIVSSGKSIGKLFKLKDSEQFNQFFTIPRPLTTINSFNDLIELQDRMIVLEYAMCKKLILRGQLEYLKEANEVLFVGSPWFGSIEQVTENNLSVNDFAKHDPLIDLLHVLKSQEITNEDLKELVTTINTQKNKLKKASKKVYDIALFAEQSPDPIIRINYEGGLIQNNPVASKLEIINYQGNTYRNDAFFELLASTIDKKTERWDFEASSNNTDFSFTCVPMPDEGHINIYGRNITKQKKYQQDLEKLSLIVQQTINAVVITNAQGEVEWVNKALEKVTEHNLSDIIGKTPGSFLQGKETNMETASYMRQQILKSEAFTCEIFNYKKSGEGYWLRINGQPIFNKQGEVINFFAIEEDITFEKQAQEKLENQRIFYEQILDNIPADIAVFDKKHHYLYVNPKGISNPKLRKWIIGKKDEDYIKKQNKPLTLLEGRRKTFESVLESKQLKSWEEELKQPDGTSKYVMRNMYPVINTNNEVELVIGFAVDITIRILAEKELKIAKKVTEELAQIKQNFLANMSHEIRTPLNAIIGMSHQLQKTALNEKQDMYLDTITNASENLLVIINDILDFSKLEAGKLSFEKIGFDLKVLFESALQVMMYKAEEKGLELTNSFSDPQLSPILLGDPFRINQILLNLISNAIKFTEKGGVDISCHVLEENDTIQHLEIKVTDSGIGMSPEFIKNIFQKFNQEDKSVARQFGGTGLGMSITKSLVNLMDGEIVVESDKGKGSVVTLRLTFEKGTETDLFKEDNILINTEILKGKKILVVDDNELNRLVATTILNQFEVLITEAKNGSEAIRLMQKNTFDLILMDIQMPEMNGYEATKIVRNKLKLSIPIIALTANAIKGEKDKCIKAGMNDYLSKPFYEDQLLEIVSSWIDHSNNSLIDSTEIKKQRPLYNLSKLEKIAKGNQQFIDKMIQLFIDQIPKSVTELKKAFNAGNYNKVKEIAHRIKPSIDTMDIHLLKNEIREIEKYVVEYQSLDELTELISKLDATIENVVNSLKQK